MITLLVNALLFWGITWLHPIAIESATEPPPNMVLAGTSVFSEGCKIVTWDTYYPDINWQIIVDHEVGHCLGLAHIAHPGVMNAVYSADTAPSVWDTIELWHHFPPPYRILTSIASDGK